MDQVLKPIAQLAARFSRLPGIGSKSALRLAYFVVDQPEEEVTALSDALREVKEKVHYCALCGNYAEGELCAICENPKRTDAVICVVQDPRDILAFERTERVFPGAIMCCTARFPLWTASARTI